MKLWTVPELESLEIDWVGLPNRFWQKNIVEILEKKGFFVANWGDNKGYPCYTECVPIQVNTPIQLLDKINDIKLIYRKYKNRTITKKLRFSILKRDNYTCQLCGRNPKDDNIKLEIDHKVPVSKGGITKQGNLWVTCFDCNRGKSDELL
jgi:hypothetical protein